MFMRLIVSLQQLIKIFQKQQLFPFSLLGKLKFKIECALRRNSEEVWKLFQSSVIRNCSSPIGLQNIFVQSRVCSTTSIFKNGCKILIQMWLFVVLVLWLVSIQFLLFRTPHRESTAKCWISSTVELSFWSAMRVQLDRTITGTKYWRPLMEWRLLPSYLLVNSLKGKLGIPRTVEQIIPSRQYFCDFV